MTQVNDGLARARTPSPDPPGKSAVSFDDSVRRSIVPHLAQSARVRAVIEQSLGRLSPTHWIEADTRGDGRVVLYGLLESREQSRKAEAAALGVPGVRSVENRIAVVQA